MAALYHGPVIEGYLFWKGVFGDWRSRYVELYDTMIVYRFVKGGMEWGRMQLSARSRCDDNSERPFCFVVVDPVSKERLSLAASNSSFKEAWIEAVVGVLTALRLAERRLRHGDHHKARSNSIGEVREKHTVYIRIIQARNLLAKDKEGCSDPYVKVTMGAATARTTTRKKNLNPDWGMVFPFTWDASMRFARIEVWDEDLSSGDHFLGMVLLPVLPLRDGDTFTAWYPLGKRSTRSTVGGDIEIELACSGMPDRESKAWRLFYLVQQLPEFSTTLASTKDGLGQIALDFESISMSRKACTVGDTDSVSSDEDGDEVTGPSSLLASATTKLHGFPLHFPPIELEKLEDFSLRVHLKTLVSGTKCTTPGLLLLTNYRLIFLPNTRIGKFGAGMDSSKTTTNSESQSVTNQSQSKGSALNGAANYDQRRQLVDLSTQIPIGAICEITSSTDVEDASSSFETIRIVTTECRTVVFQFVEDVDALANRHHHFINKTLGGLIRGVGEGVAKVGDNIHRTKNAVLNDINRRIAGDDSPAGRDALVTPVMTPTEFVEDHAGTSNNSAPGSPVNMDNTDESKKQPSQSPSPVPQPRKGSVMPSSQQDAPQYVPSKLEKCWVRLIRENISLIEGLDSEEGTPGQRIHNRLKLRVINRASEKSVAINTNMTLLHTLRTACGLNPSAPQYFFESAAEYGPVGASTAAQQLHERTSLSARDSGAQVASRQVSTTTDSIHAPYALPLGWTSTDTKNGDGSEALVALTKPERLRHECTLRSLQDRISHNEPLLNVYTKLLYNFESSWLLYDPHSEFKRMGVPNSMWRISYVNVQYELCDTYPAVLAFPKTVDDESLMAAAPFRSKQRLPTLCWRSTSNNATISRSSQPMVGLGNSRNGADEYLVKELGKASNATTDDLSVSFGSRSNNSVADSYNSMFQGVQMSDKSVSSVNTLLIGNNVVTRRYVVTDARPLLNARANQAAGKGVESDKIYENCSVVFLDIANIHSMRKSLEMMVDANLSDDVNWLKNAETAGWLGHIRRVLLGATKIVHFLAYEQLSVLVHCSDGWDRTAQLTSLSMLMMDGYYRTLKGFIVLIEKEWLSFGHKFGDRLGWTSEGFKDEERSPIFAQFLDCVHQFIVQMPSAFEFNEELLLFLMTHLHSGWFGNFLFNSEYELKFHVSHKALVSVWTAVLGNKERYINPTYTAHESPVVPIVTKSRLVVWSGWFLQWHDKVWAAGWLDNNQLDVKPETRVIDGKVCFKCELPFTITRRKHHCRCCGQIFCYACCHAKRVVPTTKSKFTQRCCHECALLLDMDYFAETETVVESNHFENSKIKSGQHANFRASLTQRPVL